MLHVAQISFYDDPRRRRAEELLQAWPTVCDVAKAAAGADVRVTVFQASAHRETLERNGIRYEFLPFGCNAPTHVGIEAFHNLVGGIKPDVLHIQGLGFSRNVVELAARMPNTPLLLQDRANRVPRFWRRRAWTRGLAAADGMIFCAREQAEPFINANLLPAQTPVYGIPGSSTRFTPGDQAEARRQTGLSGDPCVLWVGHLNGNKDPLTVLTAVSLAARSLPGIQLWCCYGDSPLLSRVRRRIDTDPYLCRRVHLMGRVPHATIETLMRAADLFVLASHREGGSFSLMEAMACGLPPIASDIPSSRALLGGGKAGALWMCGNAHQLSQALISLADEPREALRSQVRLHFEREVSFQAVGRKLRAAYEDVISRRRRQ